MSSWEETKKHSKYHFDNFKNDNQQDKVDILGQLIYDFKDDVKTIINTAKPATWRTRGENPNARSEEEYTAEEYDLCLKEGKHALWAAGALVRVASVKVV